MLRDGVGAVVRTHSFSHFGPRKGFRAPFAKVAVSVVSESLDKLLAASCPQSHVQEQKQLMSELNVFHPIVSVNQPCHAKQVPRIVEPFA